MMKKSQKSDEPRNQEKTKCMYTEQLLQQEENVSKQLYKNKDDQLTSAEGLVTFGGERQLRRRKEILHYCYDELKHAREELESNEEMVKNSVERLQLAAAVPMGKLAFFEGILVHTNEIMMNIGASMFVRRSAKQTLDAIRRRQSFVDKKMEFLTNDLRTLRIQADALDTERGPEELVTNSDQCGKSTSGKSNDSLSKPAGFIKRTPDGFLEIRERYSDSDEDTNENDISCPLNS